MERDRPAEEAQARMTRAQELAHNARNELISSVTMHFEQMTRVSVEQRHNVYSEFITVTDNIAERFHSNQDSQVAEFELFYTEIIDKSLEHPEDIEKARVYVGRKIEGVNTKRLRNNDAVNQSKQQKMQSVIDRQAQDTNLVKSREDKYMKRMLREVDIQRLISDSAQDSLEFEDYIDSKYSEFHGYRSEKIASLVSLIKDKEASLTSLILSSQIDINSFIVDLVQKRATKENTSNSGQQNNRTHQGRNRGGPRQAQGGPRGGRSQQNTGGRRQYKVGGDTKEKSRRRDPRIDALIGQETNVNRRNYAIVVKNIDVHREKGKSDADIYKMLIRNFHPDTSDHDEAEDISRIITSAYSSKTKRFSVSSTRP